MVQAVTLYERADSEFVLNSTQAGVQTLPKIAWISASQYVAVWTDGVEFSPSDPQIFAQVFNADGTLAGDSFMVNGTTAGVQTNAVVAGLAGGGFVIAWEDRYASPDGSGSAIRYQLFDAAGAPVGGESLANTTTLFDQSRPSIAGLEGGGFVITWSDDSKTGGDTSGLAVRGQLFSASGALQGSEFQVNTISHRGQTSSNVAALPGGGFAVVWQDESPQGVYTPPAGREDHGTQVALQIFDSSAAKVGDQQSVGGQFAGTYSFNDGPGRITAMSPVSAVLADGTIVVAWTDLLDGTVRTRQMNADGSPATDIALVGDWYGPVPPAPAVVALADGGYAISWTTQRFGPFDALAQGVVARVFAADGTPQAVDFQVNSSVVGDQRASTMLAFADGGFLVAWEDGGTTDIGAQRFRQDSGAIGDLALSVPAIGRATIENVQAAIVSADGALNATFTYQLLSDPTGAFRLEGDRLVVADTALLFGFGPDEVTLTFRATDSNGNSFEKAIQVPLADAPASALFQAGDQFLVTTQSATTSLAQTPELLALPDGGYLLTWAENRTSPPGVSFEAIGQLFEADGSHGPAFVINTSSAGSQFAPNAALLEGGNIAVVWTGPAQASQTTGTMFDVRGQILDQNGAKVGAEFVVNTVTAQNQSTAVPTALAGGGFLVTWADASLADDTSGTGIKAQILSATGAKVGGEFLVNGVTAGAQSMPYAAQLESGTIVIAWNDASATGGDSSGTAVRARLFGADGTPLGGEFLVNSTTLHNQYGPVVTALADGRFVIAWGDASEGLGNGASFDPADIRAQIYDAGGNPIGGEILVNTETQNFQGQGSLGAVGVAADSVGGFVVTWSSLNQFNSDGASQAIKAQLFGADGGKVGGEFLVNQVGQGNQSTPAVAYLADGDLVFAWWDIPQSVSGARGISARRFDAALQATPPVGGTPGPDALAGTAGNDVIAGYGGNDVLRLEAGGEDRASGGEGNDVLYFGTALSAGDVADGGPGRDAIVLQGNVTAVLTDTNLVGIESISIQSGANSNFGDTANNFYDYDVTTADGNVAAGQVLIVNASSLRAGEDFTFDGSAESDGKFVVYGGHGVDDLTGGDGVDVFFFEGQRWGPDDHVDGGDGRDALVISAGSGLTHIEFDADSITNIESISVNNHFATDPSQKPSYELVLHNGNVAPGGTLIVNGSSIPLGQVVGIDGRGVLDGKLTLIGGGGHDTIYAGSGADLIIGGGGADGLAGGAGADVFRYDAASDSAVGLSDLIADFQTGADKIDVSRIDANTLVGGDQAFTFIGSSAFSGSAGELRFAETGGYRFVEGDTNGDGNADFAIAFYQGSAPQVQGDFLL